MRTSPSRDNAMHSPVTVPPSRSSRGIRIGLRPRWLARGAVGVALASALLVGASLPTHRGAATIDYVTAPVERGDVHRTVTATGMVNPVETVQIGTYVSGLIQSLSCDYNTKVEKGQACAKIDARTYEAAVEQARAALASAKAQLAKDRANLEYLQRAYQRSETLAKRRVVSEEATDNARNAYRQAQAQVALDEAAIALRQAALKTAQVNLDYTDIVSPVDGTVVSRNVAVGQTVAASFQTPTLFVIATDLTRMQVDANVSESDIGLVHKGQKASFTVEAFPDRRFEGTVTQVRQAPISVQNVISYDVVIEVANPELLLKPGMTAMTNVVVGERHGVLRVSEQALRFAPAGVTGTGGQPADSKRAQVWMQRDGRLAAVAVEPGLRGGGYVEVRSGELREGDEVVTARANAEATTSAPPRPAS
jgi:HlyD family secretion protein